MSGFLPDAHPRLGTVEVDEVFVWYDAPVLFTVRNDLGYFYLATALDNDAYLYLPISVDRLLAVKTGLVAVHDAFASPEQATAFHVAGDRSVTEVASRELPPEWAPAPNFFLSVPMETAFPFTAERLSEMACRQGRRLSALEFDQAPASMRTEFAIRDLSDLLGEFQELATVVNLDGARGEPEAVRAEVELDAELTFVQIAAASFVVIVGAQRHEGRLFPVPNPALDKLANLFTAAEEGDDALTQAIRGFGKRTVAHLRDFLTALSDIGTGLTMVGAEPSGTTTSSSVSVDRARFGAAALRSTEVLPSETITFLGHLVAIDTTLKVKTFKVREARPSGTRKKRRTFRGTVDPSLAPLLDGIAVGESTSYRIRLSVDLQVSTLDEEAISRSYRLIEIEGANRLTIP